MKEKIYQQRLFLEELKKKGAMLLKQYQENVESGDRTNREGHAAKVYFNALFGMDFSEVWMIR